MIISIFGAKLGIFPETAKLFAHFFSNSYVMVCVRRLFLYSIIVPHKKIRGGATRLRP